MAKINSSTLIITMSKLVPNTAVDSAVLDHTVQEQLITIIQELVGSEVLVEVEQAE